MKAQYIILLVSLVAILLALYFKGAEGFFIASYTDCTKLKSCATCSSNTKCNWCQDVQLCYNVDASGVFIDTSGSTIDTSGVVITPAPCSGINRIKTSKSCNVYLGDLQTTESNIKASVLNASMNNLDDFDAIVKKDIKAAGLSDLSDLDVRIKDNVRSVVKDELKKDRKRSSEDVNPSDPDSDSTHQGAWYRHAHRDPRDRTETYSASCKSGVSDSGPYSNDCDCD